MRKPLDTGKGFSLIEVTLALGVAGFCLLAIFGLLPLAFNSNMAAVEQTGANALLNALAADLRATPVTNPLGLAVTSSQYQIPIPASGGSGSKTVYFDGNGKVVASAGLAHYLATVAFFPPSAGVGAKTATLATVSVTWPAAAAVANAVGSVQTFVALDRN